MAMNPMQRKANNYLLIGIFSTLVVTGAVIAFLFMQLKNMKDENAAIEKAKVEVYVLNEDVKSGTVLASTMFTKKKVDASTVPSNSTIDVSTLIDEMTLEDQFGRTAFFETDEDSDEQILYITKDEEKKEYIKTQKGSDNVYYYMDGNSKINVELSNSPVVAKVNLNANTIITPELIVKSDAIRSDDVRKQEYNMIIVPSQITSGDYVDIRLTLSTGVDFIVASKKQVTIPEVDGVPSADTISLDMTEEEIVIMANAIVEAYIDEGSILYATTYVEPGMQSSSIPTYVPSATVTSLIKINPNIQVKARNDLAARLDRDAAIRTGIIDQTLAQYNQERVDNIESKVQEQITKAKQEREKYLQSLGGN